MLISQGSSLVTAFKIALAALGIARIVRPHLVVKRVHSGGPITGSRWVVLYTGLAVFVLGISTWINLIGATVLLVGRVEILFMFIIKVSVSVSVCVYGGASYRASGRGLSGQNQ